MEVRTGIEPPLPEVSTIDDLRNTVSNSFKQTAALIGAVSKPVPDATGDGSDLSPERRSALIQKVEGALRDLTHLGVSDIKTLIELQQKKMTGEYTDDKTYLMEHMIMTVAKLPDDSANRMKLTDMFLTQLWNDLEHPPLSYLGSRYQYRSADGSYNSLRHPQLGAAGTPYARTVRPNQIQTPARPDAGVVFDAVMSRKHHELHPNRISSVLFYLASIIIHDLFKTDHGDATNSMTSSYLDLAPLYGSNQDEQDKMRTKSDGKLKPDCFSEPRLLFFPPGVGVLMIMFNRFHNYVVENLAMINESGRFAKPVEPKDPKDTKAAEKYKKDLVKYDEDLFQTGRLITCGLYINIILIDYVRTILDLNRSDTNWQLDPRANIEGLEVAVGNQVAAEFNLVYRWHSTVSDRDEKWTQEQWKELFGDRDYKSVEKDEFLKRLEEVYRKTPLEPEKRPFAGLTRNADGTLPDDPLVEILSASIEDCANSFGPQRVPAVMRAIEILGIEQARSWNLGSLNEFRKYFGLEPHRTFESITSDKLVAEQLKHLYEHPDRVEMYPGIVVEDAKMPMAPGSGLTPSYTISRAVLSDAVALVRGDRFYTVDYNPRNLTNWGFNLASSDNGVNHGCVFYKLIIRAFPHHFQEDSVYAHFPMTVPDSMRIALRHLKKESIYNYDKPQRIPEPIMIKEWKVASELMANKTDYKVTWGKNIEYLMGQESKDFMLSGDGPKNAQSRTMMEKALYINDWDKDVKDFYTRTTRQLLKEKTARIADFNQVDIIRDVGNLAHLHFCAELFMLPLKTDERPGVFTEAELYMIFSAVFALVFFNADPASSFPLHVKALEATQTLGKLIEANVREIHNGGVLSWLMEKIWPDETPLKRYGRHLIERLLQSGMDPKTLVWGHILGTAGGMVANQGQLLGQTLEYYLTTPEGQRHWPQIQTLAKLDTDEAFDQLMHYVLEGSRLYGETGVYRDVVTPTIITDSGVTHDLQPGSRLFINLRAASRDPSVFPNPEEVDLKRPVESYIHLGSGPHKCLGWDMTRVALTTMLREIARLPGLRTAKGIQGRVHKVEQAIPGAEGAPYHAYLTEAWDGYWPFPCNLKVNFD